MKRTRRVKGESMGRDISIAVSVKDKYSDAVTKMQSASKSFTKDLDGMYKKLDTLDKAQSRLKSDTDSLKKAMQDAQKEFKRTGEESKRMAHRLLAISTKMPDEI